MLFREIIAFLVWESYNVDERATCCNPPIHSFIADRKNVDSSLTDHTQACYVFTKL